MEDHIPDRGPAVFAVSVATLAVATAFVVARMISRYFIVRSVRWDDRVMILAWLIAFFLSFTIALGTTKGLGKFDKDIPDDHRHVLRRCEYVFSILYNPALMATKTSVLIFYLRLFKNTQFVLKYWSWALLGIVNLAGIILTFLNIFQCRPVKAAWDPFYSGKIDCIPLLTEFICSSPINIITNLCLLFLPIPVLTGMRLPKRQKVAVVGLFSLGIFVTVVDVIRIYFLQAALSDTPEGFDTTSDSTFGGQTDFAWNASLSFMWSAVEVNIGIICACIPTLKPLILKFLPAVLYDPDGSGTSTSKARSVDFTRRLEPSAGPPITAVSSDALPQPPSPTQPGAANDTGDDPSAAMEFLTMPAMLNEEGPEPSLSDPARNSMTDATIATENAVYFGFVNMAKPKSMLTTSASESFKYCSIVAILFLLWGISYGLLNTLNNVVATINDFSSAQTLGLTTAYWGGGYLFGPLLVGEWILRRDEHNRSNRHKKNELENVGGFKVTFIVGLSIYGIGTIIFWPSAVTGSFGGFMVSNFIVGFGLSVLEVAANAFMILCGPSEHGETRLLLAQAIQAVGSVLSGLLADKVFFSITEYSSNTSLINVQWTYLAITLLCAALGLFFYYMPLPEVSDQELEDSTKTLSVNPQKKCFGRLQLRTVALIFAVMAQYLYTAAQESNSAYFHDLLVSISPNGTDSGDGATSGSASSSDPNRPPGLALSIPDYLLVAHSAFAVSRFLAAILCYYAVSHPRLPRPRNLLTIFLALAFLFSLLPVVLRPNNADLIVVPVILFFFAEGPIWPLIFAIGLRGQGRRTKRAAAFITMGGSGGGVAPFIMYGIITSGGTVQLSYIVIVVSQVLIMVYPLFLEAVRDARHLVEPIRVARPDVGGSDEETAVDDLVAAQANQGQGSQEKGSRLSVSGGFLGKIAAKLTPSRRKSSARPEVDHNEGVVMSGQGSEETAVDRDEQN